MGVVRRSVPQPLHGPAWQQSQADDSDNNTRHCPPDAEASQKNRQSYLRFCHRHRQKQRKEGARGNQRRPLHRQNPGPVRVSQKNQEFPISIARQPKSQEERTDSPENPGRHLRLEPKKWKSEQGCDERILLQGCVVKLLMSQEPAGEAKGPSEVGG